jgi:hypothetical protein
MPFGLRRHDHEALGFEWFHSLAEVPGVEWLPPTEVTLDERLASAHPVPTDRRERHPGVPTHRWVDGAGRPIGAPYALNNSPAAVITERLYEVPPDRRLEVSLVALAHPGTRHDYANILGGAWQVILYKGVERFDLLELVLRAHVSLMLAGPRAALSEPWDEYETPLERASEPFIALISLYQREGFLREAIAVEQLLDRLPEGAKPRYMPEPRPSELIAAMRELR